MKDREKVSFYMPCQARKNESVRSDVVREVSHIT